VKLDHLRPARPHQERRLLNGVVADRDDQVGAVDRLVHVVAFRQRRGAQIEIVAAGHGALAHLRVEKRDLGAADEFRQTGGQTRAAGSGAKHHQRAFRRQDHLGGTVERRRRCYRQLDRVRRHQRQVRRLLAGDVLGQFQVHRPGPLLHRHPERVAHEGWDRRRAHDLARRLGQGPHRRHHVDDLEARLPAAHDPLLTGDQDHRHGAEMRVGRAGHQVQRSGPERGNADPGAAGQPPVRRRHERSRLLVPREHEFDARIAQGLDNVEIFLPRDAENVLDALVFQRCHQQVGSLGHGFDLFRLEFAACCSMCRST
jgi:hypothetical protein